MKKLFIFIISAVIVAVGWVIFSNIFEQEQLESNQQEFAEQQVQEVQVSLNINNGVDEPTAYETELAQGMTVFSLLEAAADDLGIVLKTQSFDIGVLVEAIDEIENGKDNKYWMYYVNGEMPMVSADKYILNQGDTVEFRFEESAF